MAELRLIALVAPVAFIACRASEAGPTSGLTPPAGWQALPSLVQAASAAAKESKIAVDGVEAWGEPARGCYAAWLALHGAGSAPDAMATQLVTGLSTEPALAGILVRDVSKPAAGAKTGVLSLAFARGIYKGKLRAALADDGTIKALACFWSYREPIACEQACTALLGSMK